VATGFYALLHFLVDGVCAWSMFGGFLAGSGNVSRMLVYNFCAFALQLPLGIVADRLEGRKVPVLFALLGTALTLAGAVAHPAVLGLGNALFHVGGGIGTIREDWSRDWKGRALGIFVAPGALGLFLGGRLAGTANPWFLLPVGIGMGLLLWRTPHPVQPEPKPIRCNSILLALSCFLVVVLRSHVGMAVSFPWKSGFWMGLLAVLAVVLGKMAGGVLAARFGMMGVTAASLVLAAAGYLLGDIPVLGLLALLCFNMTMPLTLYALVRRFPKNPGAVFGLLTFGLFLGFLPTAYGYELPLGGSLGCLLSLVLLLPAAKVVDRN
jgi:FSR family fosmidomycin resistance protein-like MFS transporter